MIAANTAASLRPSDLQTVAYFLTGSESSPDITAAGSVSPLSLRDADGIGLARSQGDRSALRQANSGSASVLPGPARVLAPEINFLQFRYFDGAAWLETWDSSTAGALPRAVEVTLQFEPPPVRAGYLMSPAVSASTEVYRMVIVVPVSDPLPPEEQS
jgi:hypothetical protein